ncbi:hypothetical protein V6N11_017421 [Hibiscus sabdariffa]|uniref:Uncharacterized protein n=1 Tax=Hibiscus sabdariffa TaxID=183260 RepID=A0ABR2TY74_9ROSI
MGFYGFQNLSLMAAAKEGSGARDSEDNAQQRRSSKVEAQIEPKHNKANNDLTKLRWRHNNKTTKRGGDLMVV